MFKRIIRAILRPLGYDIRRYSLVDDPFGILLTLAREHGVTTIIDVGANTGQFAERVFAEGWEGNILSVEPLSDAHNALTRAASAIARWQVAPRCAVGAVKGTALINVSGNSQSSSLLAALAESSQSEPGIAAIRTETVDVETLDSLVNSANQTFLLKIDAQGYELNVLKGAENLFDSVPLIYTEMALAPSYDGAPLFTELGQEIVEKGYTCVAIHQGYSRDKRMHEVDGLFVKNSALT